MTDLSQIPTDELIKMLGAHAAASPPAAQPSAGDEAMGTGEALSRGTIPGFGYVQAAGTVIGDRLGRVLNPNYPAKDQPPISYGDAFKKTNERFDAFDAQHPIAAPTLELAGALGSPVFRAIGAPIEAASKTLPRFLGYGLQGTGIGAVAGAGNARGQDGGLPSAGDVAASTGTGAAFGDLLGTALPGVLELGAAGANRFAPNVMSRLTGAGGTPAALSTINRMLLRNNMTPGDMIAGMRGIGPQATPADLPQLRGLAEVVAQRPGPSGPQAAQMLDERAAGAAPRLNQALKENLAAGDFHGTLDTLAQQRSLAAQPLYEAAFAEEKPIMSDQVDRLIQNPDVRKGINTGLRIVRNENDILPPEQQIPLADKGITFDDAGEPKYSNTPTLRLLDAGKRGLDTMIEKYRDGTTGKLNLDQYGKSLVGLRSSLVQQLDNLTGGADGAYAKARAAWAGPSQMMDAVRRGQSFINGDASVTQRVVDGMSDSQKEFMRVGAVKELQDTINSAPDGTNVARRVFGSPEKRAVLRALFPDQASYDNFAKAAQAEMTYAASRQQIGANSRTFGRQTANDELTGDNLSFLTKSPMQAAGHLVKMALNKITTPQATTDALGPMLFSQNAADHAILQSALQGIPMQQQAAQALLRGRAGQLLAPGAGGLSTLTTGGSNQ